jgi:hypothetical protein
MSTKNRPRELLRLPFVYIKSLLSSYIRSDNFVYKSNVELHPRKYCLLTLFLLLEPVWAPIGSLAER